MSKAWKPPSSRPVWIYFEFRSKPSLITVISMDPRPTNYLRQNIVFSYPEMIRVSFSSFLSLSVFCYFTLLLIFIKIILLLLFYLFIFMKIIVIFSCSGMFRDVPECSGMFGIFRNVPCSWFYRRPSVRHFFTILAETWSLNGMTTRMGAGVVSVDGICCWSVSLESTNCLTARLNRCLGYLRWLCN